MSTLYIDILISISSTRQPRGAAYIHKQTTYIIWKHRLIRTSIHAAHVRKPLNVNTHTFSTWKVKTCSNHLYIQKYVKRCKNMWSWGAVLYILYIQYIWQHTHADVYPYSSVEKVCDTNTIGLTHTSNIWTWFCFPKITFYRSSGSDICFIIYIQL